MKKRYCDIHQALVTPETDSNCDRRKLESMVAAQLEAPYSLVGCRFSTVFVVPIDDPERVQLAQRLLDAYTP